MSSSFRERGVPPAAREQTAGKGTAASPSTPFPNWLERMQNVRARHDAITRNLNTWSNYKNWAERMRTSWNEEPAAETVVPSRGKPTAPNH